MTVLALLVSCVPVFQPDRGAWVAEPVVWQDTCAAPLFVDAPWQIEEGGGTFAFALPETPAPTCVRTERDYVCDPATGATFTAAHDGVFTGRSEAEVTVHLQAPGCDTTGTTTVRADWLHLRDNPEQDGFNIFREIGLFGYEPGAGPSGATCSEDWEEFPGCENSDGTRADVQIDNRGDVVFSLFEGDILFDLIPAGQVTTYDLCVDGVYAVITFDTCITVFTVEQDGQTVVVGEPEPDTDTDLDTDLPPETFDQLCSSATDAILREVTFANGSGQAADLYYVGSSCVPLPSELLAPGAQSVRPFYAGEVWRLRSLTSEWLDEVRLQASDDGTVVVLGD